MSGYADFAHLQKAAAQIGARYYPGQAERVLALPLAQSDAPNSYTLQEAALPSWARDLAPAGRTGLIVDAACVCAGAGEEYERCDWLRAAALHLDGWIERDHEERAGPTHSYSAPLPRAASAAFDHAWANRIFLFLRRWAARNARQAEADLFGPIARGEIALTHDVDALKKTTPLRIKRAAMDAWTSARLALRGRFGAAGARVTGGARFFFTTSDYRLFDTVRAMERAKNATSAFMFFARSGAGRSAREYLLDCDYDAPDAATDMRALAGDCAIGMHPGVASWNDPKRLEGTRARVETASGRKITLCRQHWLRFSWRDTWIAQAAAGVTLDLTLGFNDRPGFRSGAALRYRPPTAPDTIEILPTMFMDSQFYDYDFPRDPGAAIRPWLEEIAAVGGQAAIIWHVHTMHPDFGWAGGYETLLAQASELGLGFMDLRS